MSPSCRPDVGLAVFVSEIDAVWSASTVAPSVWLTGPPGPSPAIVAEFEIEPASTSAWVTVYVAEQSIVAFGARVAGVVGVQVIADRPGIGSVTSTLLTVTVPVFWPWNE